MKNIYVVATLDTKGSEAEFVQRRMLEQLLDLGSEIQIKLIDAGCLGTPMVVADIGRQAVFAAAGTSVEQMATVKDRLSSIRAAALGVRALLLQAHANGELAAVFGLGGSAGTQIATTAMQALPLGLPKLMVSTVASGQVHPYVGNADILLMNSVVDLCGLNGINQLVLAQAAAAMVGMVQMRTLANNHQKPIIAASMFGVTTPCVEYAKDILESAGYEVLVFSANGVGGRAMENLIAQGSVAGVLDITTTELADEIVGGLLSAGPGRLTAAVAKGIPQVVSVGATDMVNFQSPSSVPTVFSQRLFHRHNDHVTLMRTTVEENVRIGEDLARKLAAAKDPTFVSVLLPEFGVSALDHKSQPFDDPRARRGLFEAIKQNCGEVEVTEVAAHINDKVFARLAAQTLLNLIQRSRS
jgi:uncharacterized protein (UPF0261 family)